MKSLDASRNKVRQILLEAFLRVVREVSRRGEEVKETVKVYDPVSVAASVEYVMFNKMGTYNGAKKLKYMSIMFNVKDPENPGFRRKILLGDIEPELLISLISSEEMASHRMKWKNHRIKQRVYYGLIRKPVDQDSVAKSNGEMKQSR
ncbi:hypothetical protein LWI28_017934 [Acer negundo]|uniref:TFIIS central domain-containing protein n=1 Tax=Acer negundo TaxID=4023 RepID=A0AAD5NJR5_ACENE|nr:hypothetical protein LWI28_017934 [Acer negundo]